MGAIRWLIILPVAMLANYCSGQSHNNGIIKFHGLVFTIPKNFSVAEDAINFRLKIWNEKLPGAFIIVSKVKWPPKSENEATARRMIFANNSQAILRTLGDAVEIRGPQELYANGIKYFGSNWKNRNGQITGFLSFTSKGQAFTLLAVSPSSRNLPAELIPIRSQLKTIISSIRIEKSSKN